MRGMWRASDGSAAAEFALVLPFLMFLLLGAFNLFMLVYATANLHSTTEATARYYSVTTAATGTAPTSTALNSYAAAHYKGPRIGATYAYATNGSCGQSSAGVNTGHSVTATAAYGFYYGFGTAHVPLSATACFP